MIDQLKRFIHDGIERVRRALTPQLHQRPVPVRADTPRPPVENRS
jgi:hypothetical protein